MVKPTDARELSPDQKCLALFDFDGTLTSRDTMFSFMRYAVGTPRLLLALIFLSPILLMNRMGLIPAQMAKEQLLGFLFSGWSEERLVKAGEDFSSHRIESLIRPDALERFEAHQVAGHECVVVSASLETWLLPWCQSKDVALLASRPEYVDGLATGKLTGSNCNGPEKVRRIKERYDLDEFELVYAYGDSKGDREMLDIANRPIYRMFTERPDR